MKSGYKRLGNYIRLVDERNSNLEVTTLRGLSMKKEFRKSTSNVVGTDMSNYKIVRKNRFACDFMSVIRVFKLPVVLQTIDEPILVSPAYSVFEVVDKEILIPEYLMLWFRRSEFDRYCFFKCDSAVRGGFNWTELCDTELPIPSIEKQKEIIAEYQVIENRIQLNKKLCATLEETAQTIYKHWFEDFEFPDETGNPYKSSGGEMVDCEELGKEIPIGWKVDRIDELFILQRGHDLPSQNRINGNYPIFASTGISEFHNEYKVDFPTVITGRSGSLGNVFYYDKPCWPLNTSLYITKFINSNPFHSYYFLQRLNLKEKGTGSAVPTLNRNHIHELITTIPSRFILKEFEIIASNIYDKLQSVKSQTKKLEELKSLLLGKMAVEN